MITGLTDRPAGTMTVKTEHAPKDFTIYDAEMGIPRPKKVRPPKFIPLLSYRVFPAIKTLPSEIVEL